MLHRIAVANSIEEESSAIELDSHADSPVVGKHAIILNKTGKQVKVSGFTDKLGSAIPVDVVDAALMYDCSYTGRSYLMVIRNALYVKEMNVSLIPPFVMRLADIIIDECPKFLSKSPTIENHSVYFPEHGLRLPLQIYGIISYLPARTPTDEELDNPEMQLELTPDVPDWDPHSDTYQQQEEAMINFRGELKEGSKKKFIVSSVISRALDPVAMAGDIISRSVHRIYSIKTADGSKSHVSPQQLSDIWNIGLETARKTLQVTTRLCPRTGDGITLNRRYANNDRMIRYKHLPTNIFMDTMFASRRVGKSYRGYTCVQVYASEFGWVRADLMRSEKDLHHSLKSLFKEVGVPMKLIADGAKAQVAGKARVLCERANCSVIELEKNTPFANRAERYIQTLKSGSKADMVQMDSPLVFWDYCIERRAKIENSIAKENYLLKGSVPHSVMTGEMTDISNLCNFKWYEWVKFRKPGELYPYPTEWIGRCLGPATSKGNAMSQHVLTESGEVLPVQTLRRFTPSELASPIDTAKRERMDQIIRKRFGDSKHVPNDWGDGEGNRMIQYRMTIQILWI